MLENLGKTVIVTGSQVKKSKSRLLMDFSLLSDSLLWDTKRWVGQHNWCSDSCRWKYDFLGEKHKTKAQLKINVYWQEVTKRNPKTKSSQMDEQETTPYPRSVSTLTTNCCEEIEQWRYVGTGLKKRRKKRGNRTVKVRRTRIEKKEEEKKRKSNSEGWTKPSSWWKEESGSPKDFFHNVSFLLCEDRISQILDP